MRNAFGQPQSVLVLGGTSEIALSVVERLVAARTQTVVLAGRNPSGLDLAAQELRDKGAQSVETLVFDADEPSNAQGVIDQAFEKAGGSIDLVLIAVGQLGDQDLLDNDPDGAAALFTTNLTWPVAAMTALRSKLITQGSGHVAVIASIAGVRVRRANFTYGATKAGLDAFTQGYSDSLKPYGVKVQIIRPGFVRTKMTEGMADAPFSTDVGPAADTIVKGLSSPASVIWSPPLLQGVALVMRSLPGVLWRKMPS